MSKTQPARGMRDFLPADVRKREYVIGIIKEVYESYGFEPLETPSVENLETLTGKYGEEGSQLMFKILKRGEKLAQELAMSSNLPLASPGLQGFGNWYNNLSDLALRYDLTVPLARVVANYKNDLPRFFKRYQIQPVWRADRPAKGRYREFYQCDVDAIGSKSMLVEAELCSAIIEILARLGFRDFKVRVNHRKILTGILDAADIPFEKHMDALIALDKLDKISIEGVAEEFVQRGIGENVPKITQLFSEVLERKKEIVKDLANEEKKATWNELRKKFNEATMERVAGFILKHDEGKQGILELKKILGFMEKTIFDGKIEIDLTLARGLSYYTGAIMEVVLTNGDFQGSIAGGGRYDGLIGMFGKEEIPACGISIGLERIIFVMEERGMFQKLVDEGKLRLDSADVMIAAFDESLVDECLKLAGELRKTGLRALVYPEASQKIKPLKYAEQIRVPFVCLVREADAAENKVTLKNMQTGEQETISREEIASKVKES